jgi:hypothetical protein
VAGLGPKLFGKGRIEGGRQFLESIVDARMVFTEPVAEQRPAGSDVDHGVDARTGRHLRNQIEANPVPERVP